MEIGDASMALSCSSILEALDKNVIHTIFTFLDAKDLCMVDGCSTTTRRQSKYAWHELHKHQVSATRMTMLDLNEVVASTKQKVVLHFRASRLAHKMEEKSISIDTVNDSSSTDQTGGGSVPEVVRMFDLQPTELGEVEALNEPGAFFFYVMLGQVDSKAWYKSHTLWEGFVSPMEQGAWGHSTILFFPMKELSSRAIKWTGEMEKLFEYVQEDDIDISADGEVYQNLVKLAFGGLTMTIVVCRRDDLNAGPDLLLSTRGIESVTRDNRVYFHMPSRPVRAQFNIVENEAWIFPRVVSNKPISVDKRGELFGLRLVCFGVV